MIDALDFEKMSVILTDMKGMSLIQQKTALGIIEAAIELMSQRGFHRVSVQEIGDKAGICEKTVFRYFPTKKDLLTGVIRYKSYALVLKDDFEKLRQWDLEHDLHLAARLYLMVTRAKRDAFRAYLSALDSIDTNGDDFLKDTREMLAFLLDYMEKMQQKGKVKEGNAKVMVSAFINTLHGYMLMYCLNNNEESWKAKEDSVNLTIDMFIHGFSSK